MALWNVDGEIVYSDGALTLTPEKANGIFVTRHTYKVPYSNMGKGGFFTNPEGKKYHTPSWIEVHEQTTLDDIVIEQPPFIELFTSNESDYEPRKFTSTSSDKIYTVKRGKNGFYCDCWGYIGHKKCKHVKQVQEEWDTLQ